MPLTQGALCMVWHRELRAYPHRMASWQLFSPRFRSLNQSLVFSDPAIANIYVRAHTHAHTHTHTHTHKPQTTNTHTHTHTANTQTTNTRMHTLYYKPIHMTDRHKYQDIIHTRLPCSSVSH